MASKKSTIPAFEFQTFEDYNATIPGTMQYQEIGDSDLCLFYGDDGVLREFQGQCVAAPALGAVTVTGVDEADSPDTGESVGSDTFILVVTNRTAPVVNLHVTENGSVVINKKNIKILNGVVNWGDGSYSTIKAGVAVLTPVPAA